MEFGIDTLRLVRRYLTNEQRRRWLQPTPLSKRIEMILGKAPASVIDELTALWHGSTIDDFDYANSTEVEIEIWPEHTPHS